VTLGGPTARTWAVFLASIFLAAPALASEVTVPLRIDLAFLREQLVSQLYTEPGERTPQWRDKTGCGQVQLADPRLETREGRLRVLSRGEAAGGLPIAGRCLFSVTWTGIVEVLLEPVLDPAAHRVTFRVVDSNLYDESLHKRLGPGVLWDLVKGFVHPRMATVNIDLARPFEELRAWIPTVLPGSAEQVERLLASLTMRQPEILDQGLGVIIAFNTEETAVAPPAPEPALSAEELALWENRLQVWDAFLTFVVKHAAHDVADELRRAVIDVLIDARYVSLEVLAPSGPAVTDPVPGLFLRAWDQLAPVLRDAAHGLPAETALRYTSFITAADALAALVKVGPGLGLDISADGLRRLGRMMVPVSPEDPVAYSLAIDPDLRAVLGFGPPLPSPTIDPATEIDPLSWLVTAAWAGTDSETLARLNRWAPTRRDLDEYLPLVRGLLDEVRTERLAESELAGEFRQLYRDLVFATAWQESCWRQFIRQKGSLVPLSSPVGSIGIMQVNWRVWRGVYDVAGLRRDIAYNARAGAEILFHYLRDYAIKAGEHRQPGGTDNLPRATYAIYNGGPGHLARYRKKGESRALRKIDDAFWRKFQAVRAGGELGVAECFG
jgi:hypothetical protein